MLNKKKKKNAGDQMEWATAHFQFYVATLQWCRDKRGAAHATDTSALTIEDLRACVRACQGRLVATNLLGFYVATELVHPVWRWGFLVSRVTTGFWAARVLVS